MTYQEALDYIHRHKRFASHPTLERVEKLMFLLGNPQKKLRFIHIAGTNGKGSTATMTAAVLCEAGYRTGLTISPYVIDFRERMQICGTMISEDVLAALLSEVQPLADQVDELTEFELVTGIAFLWFSRMKCDIVVAEVGLGGRFDATNVIDAPMAAVITKIGLDHTEILGNTIEKIAFEKCGIIKPGCKWVITCAEQEIDALAVIMEHCVQVGACLIQPNFLGVDIKCMDLDGSVFHYCGIKIHVPLAGRHQIENAITAIETCHTLKSDFTCDAHAFMTGIANVQFPARLEILCRSPLVIVDGAHNPNGASVLSKAFSLIGDRPLIGLFGMLSDKDSQGALEILAPHMVRMICTTPHNPRAQSAEQLAQNAKKWCNHVCASSDMEDACTLALQAARELDGVVVVCGSLYLAAQVRKFFQKEA